jgi:hypothetical protein
MSQLVNYDGVLRKKRSCNDALGECYQTPFQHFGYRCLKRCLKCMGWGFYGRKSPIQGESGFFPSWLRFQSASSTPSEAKRA